MTSPHVDWTALPGRPCSVAAALQLLGEKWALLAVREITYGNHRFVDIVRNTGAPRDRMAARLRGLVEAGILERRQYSERPERHEYLLTEAGAELRPVMLALLSWGDKWLADTPPVTVEHACGQLLDPVTTCRACGEEVRPGESTLHVNSPGWGISGPTPA
ncbi:winged helix-turn-helix transcriptional regulator [Longispora urticae]